MKVANRGQRGVNRGNFYTRFLGPPPPVGVGEHREQTGSKGVKRSEGSEQGAKGSKEGAKGAKGSEGSEQVAKGSKQGAKG